MVITIPANWKNTALSEILIRIVGGGTPSRQNPKYWDGSIPWMTVKDYATFCETATQENISQLGLKNSATTLVPKGTLILGTRIAVGKCAIYSVDVAINQDLKALFFKREISTRYMYYWFEKNQKLLSDASAGSTVNGLSLIDINKLSITYPISLDEQNAIASVLTNLDNLIESLEKLIAKKKLIKEGAMQDLLTGKKRLAGFDGEWGAIKLGDIGYTYGGLSGKSKADFGFGNDKYIPFLNVLNNIIIDTDFLESVNLKDGEIQNKVEMSDLLFNGSSETPEDVGRCAVLLDNIDSLYLNSFCFGYHITANLVNPLFLSYYFNSNEGRKIMRVLAQGATRYNLSKSNFLEIVITIPSDIPEQNAIASILTDMDTEIDALESKLAKYRRIKAGAMQQLLTGKIRLPAE